MCNSSTVSNISSSQSPLISTYCIEVKPTNILKEHCFKLFKLVALILMLSLFTSHLEARTVPIHDFSVTRDVVWANVVGMELKMDIYVPNGDCESYPVIVIYHGGGWLINHKSDMDSLSTYLAEHANYVVCNVDYRLLGENNNTTQISQIIEDAMGAAIWVKENIAAYKGDGSKIIVTGDSAGGHLASMVTLCGTNLAAYTCGSDTMFFNPTWLPSNQTRSQYVANGGIQVKAAILNYPAVNLDKLCASGFETLANPFWAIAKVEPRGIFCDSINRKMHPNYYKAVSPIYLIPNKSERILPPQLCIVGSLDIVTPPPSVKKYRNKCNDAQQSIVYWRYGGKPHGFLCSKKNVALNINFTRDAPKAIDKMIAFLDDIFYRRGN